MYALTIRPCWTMPDFATFDGVNDGGTGDAWSGAGDARPRQRALKGGRHGSAGAGAKKHRGLWVVEISDKKLSHKICNKRDLRFVKMCSLMASESSAYDPPPINICARTDHLSYRVKKKSGSQQLESKLSGGKISWRLQDCFFTWG